MNKKISKEANRQRKRLKALKNHIDKIKKKRGFHAKLVHFIQGKAF